MFKYDSTHGTFQGECREDGDKNVVVKGKTIAVYAEK